MAGGLATRQVARARTVVPKTGDRPPFLAYGGPHHTEIVPRHAFVEYHASGGEVAKVGDPVVAHDRLGQKRSRHTEHLGSSPSGFSAVGDLDTMSLDIRRAASKEQESMTMLQTRGKRPAGFEGRLTGTRDRKGQPWAGSRGGTGPGSKFTVLGVTTLQLTVLGISTLLLLTGCRTAIRVPNLGSIYNVAAKNVDYTRNPVIVIPGILGSKLVEPQSGTLVWGAFGGEGFADPDTAEGLRLVSLPMAKGKSLAALHDGVQQAGSLDEVSVNLFGLNVMLKAYAHILGTLGVGGFRDNQITDVDYGENHFTCFQFSYDWRRSSVENAKLLHEFIEQTAEYVKVEREKRFGMTEDVKFDIVSHSMGGLVTRYFLRYGSQPLPADGSLPNLTWEGAKYVDRAIFVGTPSGGSAHSVLQLSEGYQAAPLLPFYDSAVLGTFPSIYELLPRPRHRYVKDTKGNDVDMLDPEVWIRAELGLANPDNAETLEALLPNVSDPAERRSIALDHLRKSLENAKRFFAAIDRPVEARDDLDLILFAGDAVETVAHLEVDFDRGTVTPREEAPGDGTVTRGSALMDERQGQEWKPGLRSPIPWSQVRLLFTDHLAMTKDPAFTDNVLFLLLEDRN